MRLKQGMEISKTRLIFASLCFVLLSFSHLNSHSQSPAPAQEIVVSGKIRQENNQPISNVIIINQRSKTGSFGKSDGSYSVKCLKTDTITITSLGYYSRNLCFKDSVLKAEYFPTTFLEERTQTLAAVEIFAPKDLEQIQEEIKSLGFNEDDYMISGLNALASPITFLYQQFSKREESKRELARLQNEDKKRELLKDLFHHYVDYDIIQLTNDQFDEFIDFLNVSDEFMKTSTQYDFLIFVRDRFKDFKIANRKRIQFSNDDYDFDKD
jgi:hypothetical protein